MSRPLLNYLASKPVFGTSAVKKMRGGNARYASLVLARLSKSGSIKKITKNRYTLLDDIYLISTNLYAPSYLSFWSAAQYLGYTEQMVNRVQIAVTSRRKELRFEGYQVKFVPLSPKYFFGFKKIPTEKGFLFIAEDEKLLIDALLRPEEMGNFDEIIKIVERGNFNEKTLISYLTRIPNRSLRKRAGYLLEKYRHLDLSSAVKALDRNYIRLNPFLKNTTTVNRKWRVRL